MIQDLMNSFEKNEGSLTNVIKRFKDHKMLDANTPDNILEDLSLNN